jgi:hypothetical protein
MAARLEERRFPGGRIVMQSRPSGELEELDGEGCRVHVEYTADNALQIAFYPTAASDIRFVVRIRSGSTLRMVGGEEP